jgi:hypothetical protein
MKCEVNDRQNCHLQGIEMYLSKVFTQPEDISHMDII